MQERQLPPDPDYDPVAEAAAVAAARHARDATLTPSERLERLHHLCAQLAVFASVERVEPS